MPKINVPTTMQVAQMPTGPCNSSVPVLIKKTELATTTNTESPKVIKCTFPIKNINNDSKPNTLIANTIKGKGFSFSENNNTWHHSILTKELYDKALSEIE